MRARITWHCHTCHHGWETIEDYDHDAEKVLTHPDCCPGCGAVHGCTFFLVDGGTIGPDYTSASSSDTRDVEQYLDDPLMDPHPSGTTELEYRLEAAHRWGEPC